VCPTTLAALARAKHQLGTRGDALDVVFVTVDPQRDSPARMTRYAKLFDPTFIGLSGTPGQLDPIFAAYHIYHQALPGDAHGDYAVAHSSVVTLIGPAGRIRDIREWDDAPQHLAGALRRAIS
jgi:protein SCO1/2